MMSPGAESLDKMGILLSWMLNSWLQRWARCREQLLLSWGEETQGGTELLTVGLCTGYELNKMIIRHAKLCKNVCVNG